VTVTPRAEYELYVSSAGSHNNNNNYYYY